MLLNLGNQIKFIMNKIYRLPIIIFFVSIVLSSCSKDEETNTNDTTITNSCKIILPVDGYEIIQGESVIIQVEIQGDINTIVYLNNGIEFATTQLLSYEWETSQYFGTGERKIMVIAKFTDNSSITDEITVTVKKNRGSITDNRDGISYDWVQIGSQIWMTGNLLYQPINTPLDENSLTEPCYYSNSDQVYYNAIASTKACPTGWHLPTNSEWEELISFAEGYQPEYTTPPIALQLASTSWNWDISGLDYYGFNAKNFGSHDFDAPPEYYFYNIYCARFWSLTPYDDERTYAFEINSSGSTSVTVKAIKNYKGLNIRCIKNN